LWLFFVPAPVWNERAIEPERTDRGHMRAAVGVDRRQPFREGVVCLRSWRRSRVELLDDGRPVHRWQTVRHTQVHDFHWSPLRIQVRAATGRCVCGASHAPSPAPAPAPVTTLLPDRGKEP
jgi:hypothetical protein